jgi:hypothetical protein
MHPDVLLLGYEIFAKAKLCEAAFYVAQALVEVQLKRSLSQAISSSSLLSPDMIQLSEKLINSIDPLSKSTEASLEILQRDWAKELPRHDPLIVLLRRVQDFLFCSGNLSLFGSLGFGSFRIAKAVLQ